MAKETKTVITIKDKIAAKIKTVVMRETAAVVEIIAISGIVAMVTKTSKIFKEGTIIVAREKTAIVAIGASSKGSITSFDGGEKYI